MTGRAFNRPGTTEGSAHAMRSAGTLGSSNAQDLRMPENVRELRSRGHVQEFSLSIDTPRPDSLLHTQAQRQGWLRADERFDGPATP